jgi:peptide/nickel transport system substrate-binding protein
MFFAQTTGKGAINAASSNFLANKVVFGAPWEPIGFYPIRAIDSASYYAQTLVYEALVKYDAQMNFQPCLAESFSISQNRLKYTFRLRKDVQFSNGQVLTCDDVVESFKLATAPGSPFRGDYKDVSGFARENAAIFSVTLKVPNASLMSRIAELRILPASILNAADKGRNSLSRNPVGTGPFRLLKWDSGLELVFVPNEHYWADKPQIGSLIWRILPDKALLAVALNRGEIDVAQVDPESWESVLKANKQIVLERFSGSRTVYLGFNLSKPPFQFQKFREAVGLAIDRQKLIAHLYDGFAVVPASDMPRGSAYFSQAAKALPFNQNLAREALLQAEKDTNTKEIAFKILTLRDFQELAEVVSNDLARVGIKTEVEIVEYATLRKMYLQTGRFTAFIWSRSAGPDPESGLVWGKNGPLNFCRFQNEEVEKLLVEGRNPSSSTARRNAYDRMQSLLADELPWIFIAQPELLLAHSERLQNTRKAGQELTGLPWDNPIFNAPDWRIK